MFEPRSNGCRYSLRCGFCETRRLPCSLPPLPVFVEIIKSDQKPGTQIPFPQFLFLDFFYRTGHSTDQQAASHAEFRHAHVFGPKAKSPQLPLPPPPFPSLPLGSDGTFSGAIIVAVRCTGSSLTLPFDFLLPLTCIISSFCVLQLPLLSPLACEAASAAELSFFRSS